MKFIDWIDRSKGLVAMFVLLSLFFSPADTSTVQAATTTADGGKVGTGGTGAWSNAAIMVKANFFSPSKYGISGDPQKEEHYSKVFDQMFPTATLKPKSLNEMAVFLKGSGLMGPALEPLAVTSGGQDSDDMAQMYLYGDYGYRPLRFALGNDYYSTFESTGIYGVSARSMNLPSTNAYESNYGILSVNNVYMKKLLEVTNNGTDRWSNEEGEEGEQIAQAIKELWNTYVNPWSSTYKKDDANAIRYRHELASMFYDPVSGQSNWTAASAYLEKAFESNVAAGKTPTGASFTIGTGISGDDQARKIRNLMLASMVLVLADPVGGTVVSPQGKINPASSYKGEKLLNELMAWAREGGNGNDSDYHLTLKLEAYGLRGANQGTNIVTRWDQSFLSASNGGQLSNFSKAARPELGKTDINSAGLNNLYNSNPVENNKTLVQSIIENHAAKGQTVSRSSSSDEDINAWTIFQKPYLSTSGGISTGSDGTAGYNYRQIVQMTSPLYYGGARTMNTGYGYISPDGGFLAQTIEYGASTTPNALQNVELKSDLKTVPVKEKVWVDSFLDFLWGESYSDPVKNQYKLKWGQEEWKGIWTELTRMLTVIERATTPSELASTSDPNKKIPVTITINRTIVNGVDTSGKMMDDWYKTTTEIQNCPGNHHFKVVDTGDKVTITFNLIPDGKCTYEKADYNLASPLKIAAGKKGMDAITTIYNCALNTLFVEKSSRIKFRDSGIEVSSTPDVKTTVTYTYDMSFKTPTFKENKPVYGEVAKDLMRAKTSYTALGWVKLPEGGKVYPNSDWKSDGSGSFARNATISRDISFLSVDDRVPFYSNLGYEEEHPYYSEIKQGSSTNETFEAMAGTPTTRDLFMSVSGTDFRVSFTSKSAAATNPLSERIYTYIVNIANCWEMNTKCTTSCPGHGYGFHGTHPGPSDANGNPTTVPCTHWQYPPGSSCGMGQKPAGTWYTGSGCVCSQTTNQDHPDSHTWTYKVHVPIEAFTYFDMDSSEVWRLAQWGLKGGEGLLTNINPTFNMDTKLWGYDNQNYSSMNGRLLFSEAQANNQQGSNAKFGDNTTTFTVSDNTRANLKTQALNLVNNAKNAEATMKATIVSDYVVMKTSEGYQSPFFFTQEMTKTAKPSTAPNFTGEGGDSTTTDRLGVDKQLTMDDFWWKNKDAKTAATADNAWDKTSITYAGYNGDYANLSTKYINNDHKNFLNPENPLEKALTKYGLSLTQAYPNQTQDGTGTTSMGQNAGNTDHIKTGLDVIDDIPNGEKNTGKSWVKYERAMFYKNNVDQGAKSSVAGKFDITSPGVWLDENVPYFEGAEEVNDVVIQNPVSAEYAIVISNPSSMDKRTNAELMQGGDPLGVLLAICPGIGCIYSTLTCTIPLTAHVESCFEMVEDVVKHVGGLNAHDHALDKAHVHDASCYPTTYSWYHDAGCTYEGQTHQSTSNGACSVCGHTCGYIVSGPGTGSPTCGYTEGQIVCTNELNVHVDTDQCFTTYKKVMTCADPHHFTPGEPTDQNDPARHYPLGDPRCWTACGDGARHSTPTDITLPDGSSAQMGGTFINLDREFKIYFPFKGDFAETPSMSGISDTTIVRGKGYTNGMDTREWTDHRWVNFPFNVVDQNGEMILAYTNIDLNDYSRDWETFTFYLVLANDERSEAPVKFTATAANSPAADPDAYYDESSGVTNRDRVDYKYAARHSASKTHYIDVVGSIGALTINDTGDYRFSNLFKQAKTDGSYLVPNLVPEVNLNRPNYVVSDSVTSRLDPMSKSIGWLDTFGKLYNAEGGKSGGTNNEKQPLLLPLVPKYNTIQALRNQPMRPGYQLYLDAETIGNYYGETMHDATATFLDNQMMQKMQIRPMYYSLNTTTGQYTPVDAYYGVNGEYMKVYDYAFDGTDDVGVQNYYYYLDWLNESARRNYTTAERNSTNAAKVYREEEIYGGDVTVRIPNAEKDVIGSSNVLFLNDLDRTFIGSDSTYGVDHNPGDVLDSRWYNMQSQRWHFTLGLPSSVVFVEKGRPITEANIKALQSKDRVIVGAADIKVLGDVWTLQYDGKTVNNTGFQIFEGGRTYLPPRFDENGNPTTDPSQDVTSDDPILVVYPSDKTSKDDIQSGMTH